MSAGPAILLAVLLLAANAFFVGAEFSLMSARRDRLETLLEQGRTRARTVIKAGEHMSLMLAAAQLGITIASVGLGALGEPAVAHVLEAALQPVGIPDAVLHPVAFAVALTIVVVLHILLGEMIPKNIAIAGPERSAMLLVPMLVGFFKIARPFIAAFNLIANATLRLLQVQPKDELATAFTPDEVAAMLGESRKEGLLEPSQHRRLAKTLRSAARTVADVVVPTERLTTLSAAPTVGEISQVVAETGFSRYPITGRPGAPRRYVHVKDVLELLEQDPRTPIPQGRMRRLPAVPATAPLGTALARMRRASSHLAVAMDAKRGEIGVVALEDLVEEFVGTVRDGTHVARRASGSRNG